MSEEFLTRRQLRERDAAASVEPPAQPTLSRRELRDRERAIQERLEVSAQPTATHSVKIPEASFPALNPSQVPAATPEKEPEFLSQTQPFVDEANPGTIPTQLIRREVSTETNSIVLPNLPDITSSSFAVPDSNMVIHTGSIEVTQPATMTGEIKIVVQTEPIVELTASPAAGETDTGKVGVVGIDPVPARKLPKKNKEKVFPGRLRKGWGTVYLVLGVAVIMAALATAVFLAFAYKLL